MMPTENISEAPELGPPQYKRQVFVPNCDQLNENLAHPAFYENRDKTRNRLSMFNCAAVKNGSNRLLGS